MIKDENDKKTINKTLNSEWEHLKIVAAQEKDRLDGIWEDIKKQIADKGPELRAKYAEPLLDDLQKQTLAISKKVRAIADNVDEKYHVMEHFDELKAKIITLRHSLSDNTTNETEKRSRVSPSPSKKTPVNK
jgi:hypothetical protein